MLRKIKIFVSYSHKDIIQKQKFDLHLASITRGEDVEIWTDRNILAGQDWAAEINSNLVAADVVILLISSNFIASEYCYSKEMTTAIGLEKQGKMKIIPVMLSACHIESLPISTFETVPNDPQKPRYVESWSNHDEGFKNVIDEIKKAIDDFIVKFRERDIFAKKSDIERFVGMGDLERAITELMDFATNFSRDEKRKWKANSIMGIYNEDESKLNEGKFSVTQFRESRNFLLDDIYNLIQNVINEFTYIKVA